MLFESQTAELRPLLRALGDFVRDELLPLERPFLDHDFEPLLPASKRSGGWPSPSASGCRRSPPSMAAWG
jgi:hypothetical protein